MGLRVGADQGNDQLAPLAKGGGWREAPGGLSVIMINISIQLQWLQADQLWKPGNTIAWGHIVKFTWPWEVLPCIGEIIKELGNSLDAGDFDALPNNVWVHKTANVAPSAYIGNNIIIGAGAHVRHCAYIRENALIGADAVVGNSTELKNVILFDGVQVPHFNYVGDSILGFKSHLGAGSITSNAKADHSLVSVICGDNCIETGLKKFGAILGDQVEVGCNAVLNPGSVVGADTVIYPLSMVRGFIPAGSIYKTQGEIVEKR